MTIHFLYFSINVMILINKAKMTFLKIRKNFLGMIFIAIVLLLKSQLSCLFHSQGNLRLC